MKLKRKKERQLVLEALYAWHMAPKEINSIIADISYLHQLHMEVSPYVRMSLENVINNREVLDGIIDKYLNDWDFNRVAPLDIALLRLALAEMLYSDDIPPEVSINEVIELSKKYSNDKAPKFINGILDTALKDLMKEGKIRKTGKAAFNRKNEK